MAKVPISSYARKALAAIWEGPVDPILGFLTSVGYWTGDLNEVEFLDRLYPLDDLPSTDDRFKSAREDVWQHCINNCDWDGFWVVRDDRFGLADDGKLLAFLAETVHPAVRLDQGACHQLVDQYNSILRRDGTELVPVSCESGHPVYAGRRYVPTADQIRDALASAIAGKKAYEVADFCTKVGLGPYRDEFGDPMTGKFRYVRRHALSADLPLLLKASRATLIELDDSELRAIVDAAAGGGGGVAKPPKNLIFAANGPKPELVLRDSVSNDIEITKNAEFCLVYSLPLTADGLTWRDLVDWWAIDHAGADDRDIALDLHHRLRSSISSAVSPGEHIILHTYAQMYGEVSYDLPALVPQVYLHFDPRTQRSQAGPLVRQRMDFLMLLPEGARVVIEVDGKQHYADGDIASPSRYAEMVREDRKLRLAGYELYRFGGAELQNEQSAVPMLRQFFEELLRKHGIWSQAFEDRTRPKDRAAT